MGRCPAKKLLTEPDSKCTNNIAGAFRCTPSKGKDEAVTIRAITRQIQIKDTAFNLQDTKIFFESSQCLGEGEG